MAPVILQKHFVRHIYWPVSQRLKRLHTSRALDQLNSSQWESAQRLASEQWRRTKQTVCAAARAIPFYREQFKSAGFNPHCNNFAYSDFIRLPVIDKETLRDQLRHFTLPNYAGRTVTGRTSGSTGISQVLYYDNEHQSYTEAARWRGKSWWGVEPGDPQVVIWGRPFTGWKDRMGQIAKSRLMNTLFFSAFDLTADRLENIAEAIIRFKPKIIYGYPTAIYRLARHLEYRQALLRKNGLNVIMTTAEWITSEQRRLIEKVFGTPTADEYGCSETGGFAYECPHRSLHIACESVLVEFLDAGGVPVEPGSSGQIVVTDLRNKYMPLIRYRVGDTGFAVNGSCSCGRSLPTMRLILGKESDTIRLQSGARFSSEIFDYINLAVMKRFPGSILQFRIKQKSFHRFEAEIVPGNGCVGKAQSLFCQYLQDQLGRNITVHFTHVADISREPGGKLRYFVSEIH